LDEAKNMGQHQSSLIALEELSTLNTSSGVSCEAPNEWLKMRLYLLLARQIEQKVCFNQGFGFLVEEGYILILEAGKVAIDAQNSRNLKIESPRWERKYQCFTCEFCKMLV